MKTAFRILQEAYECLSDEACRTSFDERLSTVELEEQHRRHVWMSTVKEKLKDIIQVRLII